MKKIIWTIIFVVIIIMVVISIKIADNSKKQKSISGFNAGFEEYINKTIYGADVLTIINKAIDNNKFYNIKKDEKDFFIDDDNYCLKVELTLLSSNEKEEVQEVVYQMEVLEKARLDKFITSFSLTAFECTDIEYNSFGRISKVKLKQLEI